MPPIEHEETSILDINLNVLFHLQRDMLESGIMFPFIFCCTNKRAVSTIVRLQLVWHQKEPYSQKT